MQGTYLQLYLHMVQLVYQEYSIVHRNHFGASIKIDCMLDMEIVRK